MHLYASGYFDEDIQQTAYSVNIYLRPGIQASALTRLSMDSVERGQDPRIVCDFLTKSRKTTGKQRQDAAQSDSEVEYMSGTAKPKPKPRKKKPTKRKASVESISGEEDFTAALDAQDAEFIDDDEDEEEDDWLPTLRPSRSSKRARTTGGPSSSSKRPSRTDEQEVIELSSD